MPWALHVDIYKCSFFVFKNIYFLLYMHECIGYMSGNCGVQKRWLNLRNWSYKCLWTTMWLLLSASGSFERVTNTLNHLSHHFSLLLNLPNTLKSSYYFLLIYICVRKNIHILMRNFSFWRLFSLYGAFFLYGSVC